MATGGEILHNRKARQVFSAPDDLFLSPGFSRPRWRQTVVERGQAEATAVLMQDAASRGWYQWGDRKVRIQEWSDEYGDHLAVEVCMTFAELVEPARPL